MYTVYTIELTNDENTALPESCNLLRNCIFQ